MTLQEFLAQYERNTHNRDVPNIPMADAQRYLELAAQQYGNIGAIQDWSQRYADPGGNGGVSPQQMWAEQNGVRLTPMTGTTYDANGANTGQITGTVGSLGQFRDPETGKYYNLSGQYDAQGNLQDGAGIYEYSPHAGNNAFSAMGPAVRTIGGAMLGAYGLNAAVGAAGAAGSGAAGGAAAMTPAEALAAGVAPGAVGGGSMTGVVGGTAAAAGGGAGLGGLGAAAGGATTVGGLLSNPAVVGGGLSLVGGAIGADAAGDAAEMQQRSADAAIEEVRRQYDQGRADQMPWLEAGRTSLADLMGQMGALNQPFTQADFQNDPGYQFEMAEGQRALDAAARARGMYGSTGALRELTRYSQGLASTRYQDAWNRDLTQRQNTYNQLAGVAGTGQTAAGNLAALGQNRANTVGDLLTQSGNAQAAGRVGSANSWINAGSQALNNWQQQALINRLGSNLYR